MISLPEYKVMGEDGQEYGPVAAEQIHKWIAEERLERKSPVKPADLRDWVFLESLPEFAGAFQPPTPPPKRRRRKWPVAAGIIILAAGLILLVVKKFKHL
jgi:hypothetical protein